MADRSNPRFDDALAFAAQAHGAVRQARKGTDFPYLAHPIRVAEILDRFGYADEVVIAGFLHDTLEDTEVTAEELRSMFGAEILALVTAASEPDKSLPWQARKEHSLAQLEQEERRDALALVAADKLDNVRSLADRVRHDGPKTWERFNAPKEKQHWYYRSVATVLLGRESATASTSDSAG